MRHFLQVWRRGASTLSTPHARWDDSILDWHGNLRNALDGHDRYLTTGLRILYYISVWDIMGDDIGLPQASHVQRQKLYNNPVAGKQKNADQLWKSFIISFQPSQ